MAMLPLLVRPCCTPAKLSRCHSIPRSQTSLARRNIRGSARSPSLLDGLSSSHRSVLAPVAFKNGGFRSINTLSSLSRREIAALEDRLIPVLGTHVVDPLLKTNLRNLGWIDRRIDVSDQRIKVQLRLPTLLHPSLSKLKQNVKAAVLKELNGIAKEKGWELENSVTVDVQAVATQPYPMVARQVDDHNDLISRLGPGLAHVAHFLAVYSCKGGVGKSTVAVNLAYELARMGGRVGLLDVDIYGPSLPVLVHPTDPMVRKSPLGKGMVLPIEHEGVKVMSLGFVSPDSGVPGSGPAGGASVMRGPMAGRVVTQLLKGTDWGELDVLVLDLPPGTGDVQLAVCQDLQLSGAVAVTTPSKLAVTDAQKGIEMFTSLGVPTLAAVENMAYFDCEGGIRHYPFGKGILDLSTEETMDFKSLNIFQLPISALTNDANDSGLPLCVSRPKESSAELTVFEQLTEAISIELLLLQHGRSGAEGSRLGSPCTVSFKESTEEFDVATVHMSVDNAHETFTVRLFSDTGATQVTIRADELRYRHPKTGEKMTVDNFHQEGTEQTQSSDGMVQHHKHGDSGSPRLFPATVDKKGRYGYAVEWADGATIIYSLLSIARAAGGVVRNGSSE